MTTKTMKVKIVGRKPGLLTHNPASMRRPGEDMTPRKAAAAIDPPEVEAEKGVYRNEAGQCCIPGHALRSCIVSASKAFKAKKGRGSLLSVMAHIIVPDELVPLLTPNPGKPITTYEVNSQRAVVQRQGIIRSRPLFRAWAAEFEVEYDDEIMNEETILAVLAEAGSKVGIGDYRPARGGPYGRFDVSK